MGQEPVDFCPLTHTHFTSLSYKLIQHGVCVCGGGGGVDQPRCFKLVTICGTTTSTNHLQQFAKVDSRLELITFPVGKKENTQTILAVA